VPLDALQALVPPCATAFHAGRAAGRFAGQPRTARRVPVAKHCPRPTPDERLLCLLVSLKPSALQGVPGRVCGLVQGQAPPWRHVLLPALLAALRARGAAPARSLRARVQRGGVVAVDAAPGVTPLEEARAPRAPAPAGVPAAPWGPCRDGTGPRPPPRPSCTDGM
jgi:hypothetical protein